MLEGDKEIGRQRHHFPRHHEHVSIVGQHHQHHARHEQAGKHAQHRQRVAAMLEFTHIGRAINGNRQRHHADQRQEKAGQRVQPQAPGQPRQSHRQRCGLRLRQKQRLYAADHCRHCGDAQGYKSQALGHARPAPCRQCNHGGNKRKRNGEHRSLYQRHQYVFK